MICKPTQIIGRLTISDYCQPLLDYYGYHFPLQLVALCSGSASPEYLERLNRRFMHTSFAKLRKKSRFFLARDYWVPLPEHLIPPVHLDSRIITEDEILPWLNSQVNDQVSVNKTAGWKVSAVNCDNGTYILSIVVRHQLVDGVGALSVIPDLTFDDGQPLDAVETVTFIDDLKDAKKYYRRLISIAVAKKIAQLSTVALRLYTFICKRQRSSMVFDRSETVVFDMNHFSETADKYGGTTTNLGFALSANIANAILGTQENKFMTIPVKGGDTRSNSVKDAAIDLSSLPSPIIELSGIREIAKEAYKNAFVKPDRKNTWCFHSHVGPIPPESKEAFQGAFFVFGKAPLWSKNDRLYSLYPGGVTITTTFDDTITFTFTSILPIDDEDFHKIICAELMRYGLAPKKIIR